MYNIIKFPNPLQLVRRTKTIELKHVNFSFPVYEYSDSEKYIRFHIDQFDAFRDPFVFDKIIIKNNRTDNIVYFPETIIYSRYVTIKSDYIKFMDSYGGLCREKDMIENFNKYVKYFILDDIILENINGDWKVKD